MLTCHLPPRPLRVRQPQYRYAPQFTVQTLLHVKPLCLLDCCWWAKSNTTSASTQLMLLPHLLSAWGRVGVLAKSRYVLAAFQTFSRPPVTGRPCRVSSFSMTFHLPTCFSLSIGVYLRSMIFTLGKLLRFSSAIRNSASFLGLGFFTRNPSSAFAESMLSMEGSGMRTPVSCITRFIILKM